MRSPLHNPVVGWAVLITVWVLAFLVGLHFAEVI